MRRLYEISLPHAGTCIRATPARPSRVPLQFQSPDGQFFPHPVRRGATAMLVLWRTADPPRTRPRGRTPLVAPARLRRRRAVFVGGCRLPGARRLGEQLCGTYFVRVRNGGITTETVEPGAESTSSGSGVHRRLLRRARKRPLPTVPAASVFDLPAPPAASPDRPGADYFRPDVETARSTISFSRPRTAHLMLG